MEVFENLEDSLEIKRRSWEARMTPSGKQKKQVGPQCREIGVSISNNACLPFIFYSDFRPTDPVPVVPVSAMQIRCTWDNSRMCCASLCLRERLLGSLLKLFR